MAADWLALLQAGRVDFPLGWRRLADAASGEGDLAPFERLLDALQRPYEEAPELAHYAEPAPTEVTACYQTYCGT